MTSILSVSAAELSPDQAWERARAEAASKGMRRVASSQAVNLLQTISSKDNQAAVYIFGDGSTTTFVGADDMAYPVLGYVDNPSFKVNDMPPNMVAWLDEYAAQISQARELQAKQSSIIDKPEAGMTIATDNTGKRAIASSPKRISLNISPMLSTQWDQSSPYNDLAPMLNGVRTYSGCVATAMAQVLNWHKYPASATGYKSYTWSNGNNQTLSANLGEKSIDWNNMLNTYTATSGTATQRAAVAWLMKVAAYSVDMNYGTDAQGGSGAAPSAVARALYENFNYDASAEYKYRCYYEETEWDNMLVESLRDNGPIIYAGYGTGGGHCFVFDGCKTDGTFHINWGWSGNSDGYFRTSSVNPASLGAGGGTGGGFSNNQGAIFNMKKPCGGVKPEPFMGSPAGLYCTFSESGNDIRVDFGCDKSNEMLYNCGSYKGNFGIKVQLKGENGVTYDTEADYVDLDAGYGWTGQSLFYYNLPKVSDGVYELTAMYNNNGGSWKSIRWAYGACHMYKIRITGTKVEVLGRYSDTPDGNIFGYTLNIVNLPVFSNEVENVTIGTNIVSTYPNAYSETLTPHITVLEQREDGWYYVFKTNFAAKTFTLNKGNNYINFSGKVTAPKGDNYYLIFCDASNRIVGTPQKISVVGEEGGTGYIECTSHELSAFNVGQNATATMSLYCDSKNASTATMFCGLKNKATETTKYGDWVSVTLAGRETKTFVYSFAVPSDFPTGEAEFFIIRSATNSSDEPYNGGYLISPTTVNVGNGSGVEPDPGPGPVTGTVTIDVSENHPVLTIGKDNVLTFTVNNGTNQTFSKQIMPRVGTADNPFIVSTTVEKIQVDVPANTTRTFTATFNPYSWHTLGEYTMRIYDTNFKEYQPRVISVTVKAADTDPDPEPLPSNGKLICDKTTILDEVIPGRSFRYTLSLRNPAGTAVTEKVCGYMSSDSGDCFKFDDFFNITLNAGESVDKTFTFTVPGNIPAGDATFAVLRDDYSNLTNFITVNVVKSGGCSIELVNFALAERIVVSKDNTYTLTLRNNSATTHDFSGFACIENEGMDKRAYDFDINATLAPYETKVYKGVITLDSAFPIGHANFYVMNLCNGCSPKFLVDNHQIYVQNETGVEDVSVDATNVEWYTLQGIRIYGEPEKGHIYIRRQNNKVEKIKY